MVDGFPNLFFLVLPFTTGFANLSQTPDSFGPGEKRQRFSISPHSPAKAAFPWWNTFPPGVPRTAQQSCPVPPKHFHLPWSSGERFLGKTTSSSVISKGTSQKIHSGHWKAESEGNTSLIPGRHRETGFCAGPGARGGQRPPGGHS